MPTTFDTPQMDPGLQADPQETGDMPDAPTAKELDAKLLAKMGRDKRESEQQRLLYEQRWAKNIKLDRGIFSDEEASRSKVRQRSKIFFRKIWATNWRLLASLYSAFLRDEDAFRINGRLGFNVHKAQLLQTMTEYRRDKMMRENNLFEKFLWAFQDILTLGWGVAKLRWVYRPELGIDGPDITVYPPEQVFADFRADTEQEMRYLIFESYMTKEQMQEEGYDNIDEAEKSSAPFSIVRAARWYGQSDPIQNPGPNEYPQAGRYEDTDNQPQDGPLYRVWECFYRENGRVKFCVTNEAKTVLKQPIDFPTKTFFPAIFGKCLTRAHQLVGEGFPEPMEGPQESYNANMNQRKDNVSLALNKGTIVSRFGNVDLQSLVNSRPGGITLADDVNAVKEREITDVTASSYSEAATDEGMMQEISGVTPTKNGMGTESKATVAQINLSEGNAKIDLYIAIIGETFVRSFYSKLAYFIQLFETDAKVFEIAHTSWVQANADPKTMQPQMYPTDPHDLDFDAEIIVNVAAISRENEIKNLLLAIDRAVMSNQSILTLLTSGAPIPPQGVRFFDTTAFMRQLLPKIGQKNVEDFFFMVQPPPPPTPEPPPPPKVSVSVRADATHPGIGNAIAMEAIQQPPQPPPQEAGGMDAAMAGQIQPQIGQMGMLNQMNDMQQGGMGGL